MQQPSHRFSGSRHAFALILLTCGLLTGCAGGKEPTKTRFYPPAQPGGRMCTFACGKARTFAIDRCTYAQRDCMNSMQTQAIRDYEAYAKDQLKTKAPLDLFPRDFERPEKCAPVDCTDDAEKEYRRCYKSCGGHIEIE